MFDIKNVILLSIRRLAFWRVVENWQKAKKERAERVAELYMALGRLGVTSEKCDAVFRKGGLLALERLLVETVSKQRLLEKASHPDVQLTGLLTELLKARLTHRDINALLCHACDFLETAGTYSKHLQRQVREELNLREWSKASKLIAEADAKRRFFQVEHYLWASYDYLPDHRRGDLADRIISCLQAFGSGGGRFEREYYALKKDLRDAREDTDKIGVFPST